MEVIAGVNLPMLVKLAKVRSVQPLAAAVECAQEAGRKYIAAASHVLHGCKMNGTDGCVRMTASADGSAGGATGRPSWRGMSSSATGADCTRGPPRSS